MNDDAMRFWHKAQTTIKAARQILDIDLATAGSRAYYAAFYAVSALFAAEGKRFKKHKAIEAAVHRDLANTGRWPADLANAFSKLGRLRAAADYDITAEPTRGEVEKAIMQAERIIAAVRAERPELDAPA
jgi:uncharacterized protein (UPF0332 family)